MASEHAEYKSLGNIQLDHILNAKIFPPDISPEAALAEQKLAGRKPYFIPSGASTHPLGGLGFARWAFELAEQEQALGVHFDAIVVALASGSTLGGMVAGFKLVEKMQRASGRNPKPRQLIGVAATPNIDMADLVLTIAQDAAEKIGLDRNEIGYRDFTVDMRYVASGYGQVDATTTNAIVALATLEGIITDPVYTGKAVARIINTASKGEFRPGINVLFCHTGGQPVLSGYPSVR